ncbi:mitochondrial import receptor subunit tom9-2 [Quercus suber]|uniref:Mitochondrial import receptor subunit tom9-2 n=1 Tax=Quercus suber TaxID=58331 RepID=A0AAW0IZN5_QUESU
MVVNFASLCSCNPLILLEIRASHNVSQSSIVIHNKRTASEATVVSKKLLHSTSKVAGITNTTFLILAVPLIIEMDRDQQLTKIKLQNVSLLNTTPTPK